MRPGAVNPDTACAQHARFARALRRAGARVLQLPFVHGAFDSVFMKDSAILVEHDHTARALPTTFRHDERVVESAQRASQLARAGFEVTPQLSTFLEGGDVVVVPHRRVALLGHGVRSLRDSREGLAAFLRCEVIDLELADESMFHLDVALTVLSDDTVVFCPQAFTPRARSRIEMMFDKRMAVEPAVARAFALNVVEIGNTIVTGSSAAIWKGRRVIATPLDQFQLAGGSAACLVARLNALDEVNACAA
ncbi:MAG: arginine deiminase family protein [Kofleriaceae bacterium]